MNKHLYGFHFGALLCSLLMTGCVVIPTGEEGALEPEQQKSLQGVPIEEAEKVLGSPSQMLALEQRSYRIYKVQRRKGTVILIHPGFLPVISILAGEIVPPIVTDEQFAGYQCVLLEIERQAVQRVETSLDDKDTDCRALIKNNHRIMAEFRQWIAERVAEGDFAAPHVQALHLADAESLRAIAEAGHLSAALELARQFGEVEPLQRLANGGFIEAETKLTRGSPWDDGLSAALALAKEFTDPRPLRKYASLGARDAALVLAKLYDEIAPLRALANNGDVEAALELAKSHDELDRLIEFAEHSTPRTASDLFIRSGLQLYDIPEAISWLCAAANENYGESQLKLGFWHLPDIWDAMEEQQRLSLRSKGMKPDSRVAYMWYTLAAKSGIQNATTFRGAAMGQMNSQEIDEAEAMAESWRPGQCPGPAS